MILLALRSMFALLLVASLAFSSASASISIVFSKALDGSTDMVASGSGTKGAILPGLVLPDVGTFVNPVPGGLVSASTISVGLWEDGPSPGYLIDITDIRILTGTLTGNNLEFDFFEPALESEYSINVQANFAGLDFDTYFNPGTYSHLDPSDNPIPYEAVVNNPVPEPAAVVVWSALACMGLVFVSRIRRRGCTCSMRA